MSTVPNVVGMSLQQASDALLAASCKKGGVTCPIATPYNVVVAQETAAGTEVTPDFPINITMNTVSGHLSSNQIIIWSS